MPKTSESRHHVSNVSDHVLGQYLRRTHAGYAVFRLVCSKCLHLGVIVEVWIELKSLHTLAFLLPPTPPWPFLTSYSLIIGGCLRSVAFMMSS